MTSILKTENITKDYGNGKGALDINLDIKPSEIIGFIGPNGAGKTTTLKMITRLIKPNYGKVFLFGKEIKNEQDYLEVARKIGFLPSEGGLYENITAKELFNYAAALYEVNTKEVQELAVKFKLDLNTKIQNLSLGNKRKVGIIQSLLHNPKLLILDEPTSGLDPLIQKEVLTLIQRVKQDGGSILLSSHNLAEVESICDRTVMIKEGRIIFTGKTNEILKKSLRRFRIENISNGYLEEIKKLKSVKKTEYLLDDIIAYVDDIKELLTFLETKNHYDFYIERPTLEEAFLEYY
ncbi:MAG: ABC transporter ATP-binding protein [Candidatus Dojkabacteria bacterium]